MGKAIKFYPSQVKIRLENGLAQKYSLIIGCVFLTSALSLWVINEFVGEKTHAHSWFYESQSLEETESCQSTDPSPLVIISFDGLAEEYLNRGILENLDLMAERGVRAEHVKPVFPSKTLPNHYTMMTGLYPGYHGIIENWIYDPSLSPNFVDVRKTHLYDFYTNGEPIWSTYRRQTGKRVSCLYYPGCYHYPYHRPDVTEIFENVPMEHVFNRIIGEILKPKELRPGLVIGYINEPDETRHLAKKDSPELTVILKRLNEAIGTFFNVLHKANRLSCTNIVFFSDHGFTNQDQVVNATRFPVEYKYAFGDAIARYYLPDGGLSSVKAIESLKNDPQRSHFRVYNRETLPPRFHYSISKRVGDLLVVGDPGTRVGFYPYPKTPRVNLGSNHGWDYILPEMNTVFFAMGPAFKRAKVVPAFQVIEYYNLFANILQIDPKPNNGTEGALWNTLKESIKRIDPLYENDKEISACIGLETIRFPLDQDGSQQFCHHQINDNTFVIDSGNEKIVLEMVTSSMEVNGNDLVGDGQGILAVGDGLSSQKSLLFPADPQFLNTFWRALQKETKSYIERFNRLLIITGLLKERDGPVDTYFFRIFIRCDGEWDGFTCANDELTKTLAFLAPYPFEDFNQLVRIF
ncbi:unnamed protein product, partial [Mesorhabditis belari]|uniref:Uncharacterized protein n=1 Tax=Mesorhabditis belari TaxID=2138241 RepID=A0AAF3EDT4_9BILA